LRSFYIIIGAWNNRNRGRSGTTAPSALVPSATLGTGGTSEHRLTLTKMRQGRLRFSVAQPILAVLFRATLVPSGTNQNRIKDRRSPPSALLRIE
jgi:hypothetical protein